MANDVHEKPRNGHIKVFDLFWQSREPNGIILGANIFQSEGNLFQWPIRATGEVLLMKMG